MSNSFATELLSIGVQTIGENNGKYTLFRKLPPASVDFCGSLLFDERMPVGSVIIAKEDADSNITGSKCRLAVFVCCNASLPTPIDPMLVKNNRYWEELTDTGIAVVAQDA